VQDVKGVVGAHQLWGWRSIMSGVPLVFVIGLIAMTRTWGYPVNVTCVETMIGQHTPTRNFYFLDAQSAQM